jgi:hypothetical protein
MSYDILIDEYSAECTAKVLATLNPGRHPDVGHLTDMARANMWDGTTSLGTGGWEATGFMRGKDTMVVRFSVSAYAVAHYLTQTQSGETK